MQKLSRKFNIHFIVQNVWKCITLARKPLSWIKYVVLSAFAMLKAKNLRYKYRNVLKRIRKYPKNRKIRVLFLVNESSKWKTQSLCDEMVMRGGYEIIIALSNADIDWKIDDAARRCRMDENRRFFEERGLHVVEAYDIATHKARELSKFSPDIVFYQHPWSFPEVQMPRHVASFALTCYVPYFIPTSVGLDMHCRQPLHRELFRHFVLNDGFVDYFLDNIKISHYAGEILGLGHTMIDELQPHDKDDDSEGPVIYSPHWSINHPKLHSFVDLSTFLTNGQFILDYARRHPEIKWAFKPHPTLMVTLHNTGAMSDAEIDAYYKGWEEIGEACYTGDYVELFRRSRAMITDCDSFRVEYACLGKPIVHLVSSIPNKRTFTPFEFLFDTYYKVHNNDELVKVLDEIVVKREDPKRDERLSALKTSGLLGVNAAKNILDHLEKLMEIER